MKVLVLTVLIFGGFMFLMALGVMLFGRCLRGSCGGPSVADPGGEEVACGVCGRKKKVDLGEE